MLGYAPPYHQGKLPPSIFFASRINLNNTHKYDIENEMHDTIGIINSEMMPMRKVHKAIFPYGILKCFLFLVLLIVVFAYNLFANIRIKICNSNFFS